MPFCRKLCLICLSTAVKVPNKALRLKTFSMLNSVEHEILNVHMYKKYQESQHFYGSDTPKMLFSPLIYVNIYEQEKILAHLS